MQSDSMRAFSSNKPASANRSTSVNRPARHLSANRFCTPAAGSRNSVAKRSGKISSARFIDVFSSRTSPASG
jgi:hypothetical protein